MTVYLSNRDGGLTDEEGHYKFQTAVWDGDIANGLNVTQNSPLGMSVLVQAGNGKIPYDDYDYTFWVPDGSTQSVTITTANPSNPRIDRIVAYCDRSEIPQQITPNNPGIVKIVAVAGTAAASPTRPNDAAVDSAVSNNPWINLADVAVGTSVTQITNSNITDTRQFIYSPTDTLGPSGGWGAINSTPNTITYDGNRSYTATFNGVDLTSTLSIGSKLKLTRTVAAPTQCTSLNGSSQYWVKTSPNKLTFTDDFVVSAWVKLNAYNTSANQVIASRFNGTSGWQLYIDTGGRPIIIGYNGGGSNQSNINTYQSIPTGKWVHITGQLDMSAFTNSTTTSYIMIDGVNVPAVVSRGGSNPTALVQAGNLEIGSSNSGANPFNGKIAQVAIFNSKVTQATMRGYISQGLAGTETSLASAYSFNNSVNDLNTTTPNNLSVGGGSAVATNADSPFGLDDNLVASATLTYGVVTSKSFSTNTTITVQVPEGCTIPTTGGISTAEYSIYGQPFGFPDKSRYQLQSIIRVSAVTSGTSTNTWYNPGGFQLSVPVGNWKLSYQFNIQVNHSGASDTYTSLSTSPSSCTNQEYATRDYTNSGTIRIFKTQEDDYVLNTVAVPYYAVILSAAAFSSFAILGIINGNTPVISTITAEPVANM